MTLIEWPGRYAGQYDCDTCGSSMGCDHPSTHVERLSGEEFNGLGEIDEYYAEAEICDECGLMLEDY